MLLASGLIVWQGEWIIDDSYFGIFTIEFIFYR